MLFAANAIISATLADDAIGRSPKIATGALTADAFAGRCTCRATLATEQSQPTHSQRMQSWQPRSPRIRSPPTPWLRSSDRDANGAAIANGTCQAGSTVNNIILAAGASATDDLYTAAGDDRIRHGAGRARLIADYSGTTKGRYRKRSRETHLSTTACIAYTVLRCSDSRYGVGAWCGSFPTVPGASVTTKVYMLAYSSYYGYWSRSAG